MKAHVMKWNKSTLISLLMVLFICIGSVACGNSQNNDNRDSSAKQKVEIDSTEPIIVFYDGDLSILQNFMSAYPDIQLKIYRMYMGAYEEGKFEEYVEEYGNPDIVLTQDYGYGNNVRIENWYYNGLIANISEYYESDTTINESDYVTGTFDVLNNGEALLGIPLAWEKSCLIIRDSKWADSEFMYLNEEYTGTELYRALSIELQKKRAEDEFFLAFSSDLIDALYELNAVGTNEEGEIVIDEPTFELLYDFYMQREGVDAEVYEGEMNHPALDPEVCGGKYFGCVLDGAPQVTSIYAKSAAPLFGEDVHLLWTPTANDGNEYVGRVTHIACLGGQSERKEEAYEVIRLMMDMPIQVINQPHSNISAPTYSPVNIEQALALLDYFDDQERNLTLTGFTGNVIDTVAKQKLSQEEKEKLQSVICGTTSLSFAFDNQELYTIYDTYLNSYRNGIEVNYKQCYLEFMRALNPDSEKWNMTPEEIENYLNSD